MKFGLAASRSSEAVDMLNAAAEMFRYGMQKTTGLKLKKFQSNISHMKPIQKIF